jgi:hypothetical protein
VKLAPEIAEGVGIAAQRWAEAMTELPLIIRKTADGVVCATSDRQRYTCAEFAELLGMSPNTWRKRVKDHLGLTAASDGQYDAETVQWARDQLRQEESRATPHERRRRATL